MSGARRRRTNGADHPGRTGGCRGVSGATLLVRVDLVVYVTTESTRIGGRPALGATTAGGPPYPVGARRSSRSASRRIPCARAAAAAAAASVGASAGRSTAIGCRVATCR